VVTFWLISTSDWCQFVNYPHHWKSLEAFFVNTSSDMSWWWLLRSSKYIHGKQCYVFLQATHCEHGFNISNLIKNTKLIIRLNTLNSRLFHANIHYWSKGFLVDWGAQTSILQMNVKDVKGQRILENLWRLRYVIKQFESYVHLNNFLCHLYVVFYM